MPFIVDRREYPRIQILNVSDEPVHHLRLSMAGPGVFITQHSGGLAPGEAAEVTVVGDNLAQETLLVLRWFRPEGQEYLWQISF